MSTPYPYEVTEDPRSLSDGDLAFLSKYTGVKDYDQLREHVLEVWRSVKAQVRGLHVACVTAHMLASTPWH